MLPCPFCGGTAKANFVLGEHWIECRHCRAQTALVEKLDRAVEIWNNRTKPPPKPATRKHRPLRSWVVYVWDKPPKINQELTEAITKYDVVAKSRSNAIAIAVDRHISDGHQLEDGEKYYSARVKK
jgi:hypothetical protein